MNSELLFLFISVQLFVIFEYVCVCSLWGLCVACLFTRERESFQRRCRWKIHNLKKNIFKGNKHAFCRPSTPRNVVSCAVKKGGVHAHTLQLWKTNSADMASSWHFMLCCLSLFAGAELVLGARNRSATAPVNQTSSPPGATVLIRHGTRSGERRVSPTKPPVRILSTRAKPEVFRFGTEDLDEEIEPSLERRVWGKGREDETTKLGKIISWC